MKVEGSVFVTARKRIRADFPGRGEPGQPAKGTQEWLAEEAGVSLRAVQYLEKGEASLKTLKSVSRVLGIESWEKCIQGYGAEYVNCTAKKIIDFRPENYPEDFPDTYMNSIMQMTIDPLSIYAEPGKSDFFTLREVNAKLVGLEQDIYFTWWAEVSLTPNMTTWLGWVREVQEFNIEANGQVVNKPIMFRQTSIQRVSWADFVRMVDSSNKSQFDIELELKFARFDKALNIYVSIDLLTILFEQGRVKYKSKWPHRAQIKTIL